MTLAVLQAIIICVKVALGALVCGPPYGLGMLP